MYAENPELVRRLRDSSSRIRTHLAALTTLAALSLVMTTIGTEASAQKSAKEGDDPYASYVWPPPPNKARFKLERIITGRRDVESGGSKMKRFLIGASPPGPFDLLEKPTGVAIDDRGRILVTDWAKGALYRFDIDDARMDVFGTAGETTLKRPLGVDVAPDGTIWVADQEQAIVIGFDADGNVKRVLAGNGQTDNPVGVTVSPDGAELYVVDSKKHAIMVFDITSGKVVREIGKGGGDQPGQFAFPTALDFDEDGNLVVVDQLNARVQLLTPDGEFEDAFGGLGVGFGDFVRPKDIAITSEGLMLVTDQAFNNFQVFDIDFTLLTFVGSGGSGPGQMQGIFGIDERDGLIVVAEQLGKRVQVFRYLGEAGGE